MDDTKIQNASHNSQYHERDDAEMARLRLMQSLTFEQKLAWLDWAFHQVVAKYGWDAALRNDPVEIDPPQFEAAHLQFIQQGTLES